MRTIAALLLLDLPDLFIEGVWYGIHLVAEQDGLDVIGASMPGLPGVLTGRNR